MCENFKLFEAILEIFIDFFDFNSYFKKLATFQKILLIKRQTNKAFGPITYTFEGIIDKNRSNSFTRSVSRKIKLHQPIHLSLRSELKRKI